MGMSSNGFVRSVGGDVRSSVIANAPSMRIEKIRRVANGPWYWHFRQPELCLFWFHEPRLQTLRASVNGRPVNHDFLGGSQLCLLPPRTEIEGEWKAGLKTSYTVAFLSPELVDQRLKSKISRPVFAFEHPALLRSLSELSTEAIRPDGLFGLLAEGWSIQALAYIARVAQGEEKQERRASGGLSNRNARIVMEYINGHIGEEMTLQSLAEQVGLSKRHFQRAFQNTFGTAPHRYIIQQRITTAKHELCLTKNSITDVALTNGFCQLEHFANAFRRFTGLTPSQFREQNS